VKFANLLEQPDNSGVSFVWYGEGSGPSGSYRHFGEAFQLTHPSQPSGIRGHAASLTGNGEQASGYAGDLRFTVRQASGGIPQRVGVQGEWREEWVLEPDGIVEGYQSPLGPIRTGGRWFHELSVSSDDPFPGEGVRLMLATGSWLGAGQWFGKPYLHLGTFIGDPTEQGSPVAFGAADICHEYGYCGSVEWGHLLVRPAPRLGEGCFRVGGAWGEEWILRHSAMGWTLAEELAAISIRNRP